MSERWSVPCGCEWHGDHLGCDDRCKGYSGSCVHPLGTEVTVSTEEEADRLLDTSPLHALAEVPPQPVWTQVWIQVAPDLGAGFGGNDDESSNLADFIDYVERDLAATLASTGKIIGRDLDSGYHVTDVRKDLP